MKPAKVVIFLTVVILLMGLVLGTSCGQVVIEKGPTGVGTVKVKAGWDGYDNWSTNPVTVVADGQTVTWDSSACAACNG